jgi:hypothetical protein
MPAHIQQMRAMAESAPAADGGWQELSAADGDVRVHQVPPTMGDVPRASATSTTPGSASGYPHPAPHHFVASRPYGEHPQASGSPHEGHGRPLPPTRFNPVRVPAPSVAEPDYLSDGEHSEDSAISRAAALVSEAIKHHEARQAAMERHQERTQAFADSIRADINTFYAAPVPANPAEHAMSGMRSKVGKEQNKVRSCHLPSDAQKTTPTHKGEPQEHSSPLSPRPQCSVQPMLTYDFTRPRRQGKLTVCSAPPQLNGKVDDILNMIHGAENHMPMFGDE